MNFLSLIRKGKYSNFGGDPPYIRKKPAEISGGGPNYFSLIRKEKYLGRRIYFP
jgi:hypothetical protein